MIKMRTVGTTALATLIALGLSTPALAKGDITLNDTFPLANNGTLHLDIPVGEIELTTHDSNEISVEVRVKPQNDGWFSDEDVSEAKFKHRQEDGHVYLEIDQEKSVQEWIIAIPKNASIDLDVGVGEVNLDDVNANVFVDVGVGEVDVELTDNNYAMIHLDTGVGDVDLDGFKNAKWDKGMVSGSVRWNGDGEHKINIDVGVGEIEVDH